jgi:hypothetical protein
MRAQERFTFLCGGSGGVGSLAGDEVDWLNGGHDLVNRGHLDGALVGSVDGVGEGAADAIDQACLSLSLWDGASHGESRQAECNDCGDSHIEVGRFVKES